MVPLDTGLVVGEVFEGDTVLLVDPGTAPAADDPGRPRQTIRPFRLENFNDSQMTLFVAPEEWYEWRVLLEGLGGVLQVVRVLPGADPDEMARRVDAVWQQQWSDTVAEILAAEAATAPPAPAAGQLELFVSLDAGLVPTEVREGDLVLLVDPGAQPSGTDAGRPRSVLQTMTLQNYSNGQMQMFLPPEDWARWRALPETLGADPMIIPVAPGTDVGDMIERLDAEWDRQWRAAYAELPEALDGTDG